MTTHLGKYNFFWLARQFWCTEENCAIMKQYILQQEGAYLLQKVLYNWPPFEKVCQQQTL